MKVASIQNNKKNILFSCSSCQKITKKWQGVCPHCNLWNTLGEVEGNVIAFSQKASESASPITMRLLHTIEMRQEKRMLTGIHEWDRVTGNGIMPGSFLILTGDPGIGKSTLLLQVAHALSREFKIFYFSVEESLEQVKVRAQRIACHDTKIFFSDQVNLDTIIATAEQQEPDMLIIDSIQNCSITQDKLSPGNMGQLREAAFRLMRLAKERTISVLLSGHITKEGFMAGPKTLEHMVDAVFYLQGEDRWQTRMLRSIKNRFGTINEIGFFEMHEQGMQEIKNINQQIIQSISNDSGSVLTSYIEGTRILLVEFQALTVPTKFSMPQRIVSGIDQTQIILIVAILEKYLRIKLNGQDIFFKVSGGGLKVKESSSDLGIALALLSSYFQQPLPIKSIAFGEISLTGHIKPVNHVNRYITEADKFGINSIFIAKYQKIDQFGSSIQFHRCNTIYDLLGFFPVKQRISKERADDHTEIRDE